VSVDLIKMLGFTAFGVLAALKDCFPQGNGIINLFQFTQERKVSRSALTVQLRTLEQNGLIQLGPPEQRGRSIKIFCLDNGAWCHISDTLTENRNPSSSSSYYIKQQLLQKKVPENRNLTENRLPENRNPLSEDRTPDFLPDELVLVTPVSGNVNYSSDGGEDKLPHLAAWERAQIRGQAEELFYLGLIAKIEPEAFSLQTLILYSQIAKERGKDWTAALFLILLPKAKDNPTGYISTACRNGAEPTSASITRVRTMWEPLEAIERIPTSPSLKDRIHDAVEKEDFDTITSLTKTQALVKAALQILSWTTTLDDLFKRRNAFIDSLLDLK
jgi:hypothetical protein